jgi:hypothetical protein
MGIVKTMKIGNSGAVEKVGESTDKRSRRLLPLWGKWTCTSGIAIIVLGIMDHFSETQRTVK